ncbi:MAG: DUF362 domain-containing protein [Candidatus Woesearchaeota archaeon]|jgi:uncharacterized protein (DUF362 family)|nr:DUF362 domain-containing protein [Candidatus Woesearchaeota archaeon]|tara:strand:- start:772 stop:1905 length:1134 start_codon:yes stop_codon:yes gene_type:complete
MIIRWVCKKCSKEWIYPVERCIYCKDNIEKKISRKLKVVGFTKVNIPSVMHPIIPYNILILEDENGNRIPKKTIKDYEIGDFYEEESSKKENAVSIVKIKYDVDIAVEEALHLINDLDVNESSKILIKPNMMAASYPYLAITTNPKTVSAVIKYLIKKGAKKENISIAEQCIYAPFEAALKKTGFEQLCKSHGIKFIDLSKSKFVEKDIGGMNIKITKEVFDKDLIINIPVLKTHLLFGISGAFENIARAVSKENLLQIENLAKERKIDPDDVIAKLHKLLPKYITIGDGTIGMEGNGPLNGNPAFLNYILASKDPVAHDAVFNELGLFMRKSRYLEIANKLGLGDNNIEKIDIAGNELMATARELSPAIGSKLMKI